MQSDPYSTTATTTTTSGPSAVVLIVYLLIFALAIASLWKIFSKAGKPGWAAIVPFYNIIVELQIIERPVWWIVLYFIPIVNVVIAIIIAIDLAKAFGKSGVWGFFMLGLLSIIGYPMLAFGSAQYVGKGGNGMPGPGSPAAPGMAPPSMAPSMPQTPPAQPGAPTDTPPPPPTPGV